MFNNFKNSQSSSSNPCTPLLKTDGSKTESDSEKANVFAAHLEQIFQFPNDPFFDNEWKEQVEEEVRNIEFSLDSCEGDMTENLNQEITPDILRAKIAQTKKISSPGEDKTS